MKSASARTRNRLGRWPALIRLRLVAAVRSPVATAGGDGRSRRAAVALAVGVVVVAASQLALGWAIRTERVPVRDPLYSDKFAALRSHPGFAQSGVERPLTVVFLGSSRTHNGIDAGAAEAVLAARIGRPVAAFNFGCPAAGPVTSAVYLRRLLADGVKPDAVVLEVHPLLLAAQTDLPPEAHWAPDLRARPEEVPYVRGLGFPVAEPPAHGWRGRLLPLHEYRMALIDRYATQLSLARGPAGGLRDDDPRGFMRLPEPLPGWRPKSLERTRREYAPFLAGYRPGGCGVAALRDALETCRTAEVRPALLLTPESSEFRGWYPEPGRSQLAALLAEVARDFGCPLFDGREWVPDEWTRDGHHLTGRGADAFTDRLAREALVPWLSVFAGGRGR